jgi:hypothetical protein
VPTAGRSRTITICYLEPSTINAAVAHVPPSLPVLLAMASTTQQETHDALGSIMQEMHNTLHTMVADKLKIAAEQQECLYKLEVMAGIRSAVTEPPLLPTLKAVTGTSVPPPLPYTPSPQPVVWLEPPPTEAAGAIEVGDGKAISCGPETRPASAPTSLTTDAVPTCRPELPPAPPLSASTGAATATGFATTSYIRFCEAFSLKTSSNLYDSQLQLFFFSLSFLHCRTQEHQHCSRIFTFAG